MAIILRENQYKGVNAHLHSYLLNGGDYWTWDMFCQLHACHIAETIDSLLPENYEVTPYFHDVLELYEVVIWQIEENGNRTAVIRIAILAPRHKSHETIRVLYKDRRLELLRQITVLAEIDYLHELDPIHKVIPSYAKREENTFPFSAYIINPRPSIVEGSLYLYGFIVDEPIPHLQISLTESEAVRFDLDAAYQRTFKSLRYFSNHVDYEQLPHNFEAYSLADQARIRAVMGRVYGANAAT